MPDATFSMLKTYRQCQKKFSYKYKEKIGRKKPVSQMYRGTILHEMLDARAMRLKDPDDILRKYAKEYKKLFLEERDEDFIGDIARIYDGYERLYKDEDLVYEESETAAITDLTSSIRYCGTIDKVVTTKKDGRRWIMDHKTHKTIPTDEQRLADLQLVLYVWAWNRWNPDRPVDGIIWDYLRTKPPAIPETLAKGGLTQRQNIDTDFYTYMSEVKRQKLDPEDYSEILGKLQKQPSKFYRRIKLPSPSKTLTASIIEDAKSTAIQMHRLTPITAPRNLTFMCESCEYFRLCTAELRGLDAAFVRKAEYEDQEPRDYTSEDLD